MLRQRILTGVVAVPILIGAAFDGPGVLLDGWLFRAVILVFALLGTNEAISMARQAGHRPVEWLANLLTLLILLDALFAPGRLIPAGLGVIVLGGLAVLVLRADQEGSLVDWTLTLAMPLYVAGLLQFYAHLRLRPDPGAIGLPLGLALPLTWPAMVLVSSWVCDSSAYFFGRARGRTPLAPAISPKKSVEGALAGVVAAMMLGVLFALPTGLNPFVLAGFGFSVGVGSVIGDLAESLLKRQCGVKDSGVLMPGHGGILDRMDALIASALCAHLYLSLTLGPTG